MKKLCIYHGNCVDGFGAAWSVRKALGDEVTFHQGKFSDPPPDVTGLEVIIVDFSYKKPVLLEMAAKAKSILILDHHKTAEEDLKGLPDNVTTVFDVTRSGARITWDYFHPNTPPPLLILHIEDRDIWKFAMPYTREINANLFSYPYDFDVWDRLMAEEVWELITDGEAIERKHFKDINELLGVTRRWLCIHGTIVPAANMAYTMSSDAGHIMAEGQPFAACYWDTPKGRMFSLRSDKDGVDVSKIASHYGGGGHFHAAGFMVSYKQAESFEIATETVI